VAYSEQYPAYKKLREGFKMMDYGQYLYPHRVIFGDPDQCAERIAQIRATGITNIGLIGNFGGLERGKILASLDRFAKYVMPRFA
jgi:alkanesulfonate monooxygenase SsuD/methylene tetrahydromethanopterin reductase-like flavin-dependent oxidoreductase (luciferase family)